MIGVEALLGSQGETQESPPLGVLCGEGRAEGEGVEAQRRENCPSRISLGFTWIMDLGFVCESLGCHDRDPLTPALKHALAENWC